jgi:hypothetical protein
MKNAFSWSRSSRTAPTRTNAVKMGASMVRGILPRYTGRGPGVGSALLSQDATRPRLHQRLQFAIALCDSAREVASVGAVARAVR